MKTKTWITQSASTLGVLAFCATLAACPPQLPPKGQDGGHDASDATLEALSVGPTDPVLPVGLTVQLTATGTYSDSSTKNDIVDQVSWTISDPTVVGIDAATGVLTALKLGTATVTGAIGSISAPSLMITVTKEQLVTIDVTPKDMEVTEGNSQQYAATATYTDHSTHDITNTVAWHSGDPAKATINSTGKLMAAAVGTTSISANVGTIVGQTNVIVTARIPLMIVLSEPTTTAAKGQTIQFTATATYNNQTTGDVSGGATWSSSNGSVASVNAGGLVTCVGEGMANITAALGELSATQSVTCGPHVVVSLSFTPTGQRVPAGSTLQLSLIATYSDGLTADLTNSGATFESNRRSVATVSSPGGLVTTIIQGTVVITATVEDPTSLVPSATLTINVDPPKLVQIDITRVDGSTSTETPLGVWLDYVATGTYTDHTTRDVTDAATWESSDTAIAGNPLPAPTGQGKRVTPTAIGTTTISARVDSVTGTASLTVIAARLAQIEVLPSSSPVPLTIALGQTKQLTALGTYTDGHMEDVTTQAQWTSAVSALVLVTNAPTPGLVRGVSQTSTAVAITASVTLADNTTTISGTAQIKVGPPQPEQLTVTTQSGPAEVAKGLSLQLVATVKMTDGTIITQTSGPTWAASSDTATVSGSGLVTGKKEGMVVITATSGGISGTLTITVKPPVPTALSLTPRPASVAMGNTLQLTATMTYSDGSTTNVSMAATWASSDESILTVSGGLVATVSVGTTSVIATYQGITSPELVVEVRPPELKQLDLTPLNPTVPLGAHQPMTAIGTYTDMSTQDLTASVTWLSSVPAVATIDATGLITTLSQGQATIQALAGGVQASTVLTVGPKAPVSLEITPDELKFPLGLTLTLVVKATYTDGSTADVTQSVDWTSSNDNIASVSGGTADGYQTGIVNITASLPDTDVEVTRSLEVLSPALVSLEIEPQAPSLPLGVSQQLVVWGTYTDGDVRNNLLTTDPNLFCSSRTESVATINQGLVQSVGKGSSIISCSSGAISATTVVTVIDPVVKALRIEPSTLSLALGRTATIVAVGTFTDGIDRDVTGKVGWTNENEHATVDEHGVVTTESKGSTVLTAGIEGLPQANGDTYYSASINVVVTDPELDHLVVTSASGSNVSMGRTLQLIATAVYSDATEVVVTTTGASWVSSAPAVATVGATNGLVTPLSVGRTDVTATYQGRTSGPFPVQVDPPDIVSIAVTPASLSFPLGKSGNLTAMGTFTAGPQRDITNEVTWTVQDPSVATIGQDGKVTGVTASPFSPTFATASMTNHAGDIITSAMVPITVQDPAVELLTISDPAPSLPNGTYLQLTLTAKLTDGTTIDATSYATWTTLPAITGIISVTGGFLSAQSIGSAFVVGSYGGKTLQIPVTVTQPICTSILINPVNPEVPVGTFVQLTAQCFMSDSTLAPVTSSAAWSTTAPLVATVSRGKVTGLADGETTIQVTYQNPTGYQPVIQTTQVFVTDAVLTSVTISPTNIAMPLGTTRQLTCTAKWSDGNSRDVTYDADTVWTTAESDYATVTDDTTMPNGSTSSGLVSTAFYSQVSTTVSCTYGEMTANTIVRIQDAALQRITIQPGSANIPTGKDQQFTAKGYFTDGTTSDVTQLATWSTDDESVATVTNGVPPPFGSLCTNQYGCVKNIQMGTVTLTATIGTVSGTAQVTLGPVSVDRIEIHVADPTVDPAALSLGDIIVLQAFAVYSNGTSKRLTAGVVWSSTTEDVAQVTSTGGDGTVATYEQGGATILASFGGKTGDLNIQVGPVSLKTIVLTPTDPTLYAGQTIQLSAIGVYSDGSMQDKTSVASYTTDDSSVAKASVTGLLKGYMEGDATITATFGGKSGSILVTVGPPQLNQIQIILVEQLNPLQTCTTTSFKTTPGEEFHLLAIARYTDGTYDDITKQVTWSLLPVNQSSAFNYLEDNIEIVRTYNTATANFTVQAAWSGVTGSAGIVFR